MGRKAPGEVGILAAWGSPSDYEGFMAARHDGITSRSGQAETYRPVLTQLFAVLFPMTGTVADGVDAFTSAGLVRIAHCSVRPDREEHFRTVHRELWAPGMSRAGMRGGLFAKEWRGGTDCLVCSAWSTESDHEDYLRIDFPGLRSRADVESDVERLTGSLLRLEPAWTVRGVP